MSEEEDKDTAEKVDKDKKTSASCSSSPSRKSRGGLLRSDASLGIKDSIPGVFRWPPPEGTRARQT